MATEKMKINIEHTPNAREESLQVALDLRNNHIDDLPPTRLLPEDKNYLLYKCRGNFFAAVRNLIDHVIRKGVIKNPEAIRVGQDFIQHLRTRDPQKFYSKEEINEVNIILDLMIKELS